MLPHPRAPLFLFVTFALGACSRPAMPAEAPATPAPTVVPPAPAATPAAPAPVNAAERVHVTAPLANALITSPLRISGQARGNWYFEATFPVVLRDAHGKELGKHYATADGEWMTEEFVPFTAQLEFAKPSTETGTLVLQRANASGLPEHDAALSVPVRFDAHVIPAAPEGAAAPASTCSSAAKIAFTQAQGCVNDGSVEFCFPRKGLAVPLKAAPAPLRAISRALRCNPGHGRAGCNETQVLCSYPTSGNLCSARHGALDDRAWAELCAIAALPEVTKIVPTWYE